jgi:integrase
LGRPRQTNLRLPRRLHLRGKVYWYVTNSKPRKWIRLGTDPRAALARWAELEGGHDAQTVEALVERTLALIPAKRAAGTKRQYRTWANAVIRKFGQMPAGALKTYHVAQWRDDMIDRPSWANGCITIIGLAYRKAREWGWCEHDPCPDRLEPNKRNRELTRDEFRAIRASAPAWLQNAMDLSYLTSRRESDIVGLRWESVGEVITGRLQKTKTPQELEVNEAVQSVLDRCREGRVRGLYVIADHRGQPITEGRLQKWYQKARIKAAVEYTTFHDVRGLAASDAKRDGLDYQALLGHSTKRQSDAYLRGIFPQRVTPNRKVL